MNFGPTAYHQLVHELTQYSQYRVLSNSNIISARLAVAHAATRDSWLIIFSETNAMLKYEYDAGLQIRG